MRKLEHLIEAALCRQSADQLLKQGTQRWDEWHIGSRGPWARTKSIGLTAEPRRSARKPIYIIVKKGK